MVFALRYLVRVKNKLKKSVDRLTMFCDSVRVLAADALRISLYGLNHKLLFEIKNFSLW